MRGLVFGLFAGVACIFAFDSSFPVFAHCVESAVLGDGFCLQGRSGTDPAGNPVTLLAMASRKKDQAEASSASEKPATLGPGPWTVVEINGESTADPKPDILFDLENNSISGSTSVNRYSGTCEVKGNSLKLGPLISTRMAGPPEAMAQETEFVKIMDGELTWRATDGGVELLKDGSPVARLSPAE